MEIPKPTEDDKQFFRSIVPEDPEVEVKPMFGNLGAFVHGNMFAGLFGRSVMVYLAEPKRSEALALDGASYFDPMGDGKRRSDKVMLPESMMDEPDELRAWLRTAFDAALKLPRKVAKKKK